MDAIQNSPVELRPTTSDNHIGSLPPLTASRTTSHSSGETSPVVENHAFAEAAAQKKKKKKKKPKKSAKVKELEAQAKALQDLAESERPPVLCISRNKHWRYISSYHVSFVCVFVRLVTKPEEHCIGAVATITS